MLKLNVGGITCGKLLKKMNLKLHPHNKKKCPKGYQSEHYVGNEYFQIDRPSNTSYDQWKNYSQHRAPCVCIRSMKHKKGGGFQEKGPGSRKDTPHDTKTKAVNDYNQKRMAQTGRSPKLRGAVAKGTKSIKQEQHKECKDASPAVQEKVAKCLTMIFMAYMQKIVGPPPPEKTMEELNEMRTMRHRTVR